MHSSSTFSVLVHCMHYLLVHHNTYGSLCDIPHLASAAMVHLVGHTLKQAARNERHSKDEYHLL